MRPFCYKQKVFTAETRSRREKQFIREKQKRSQITAYIAMTKKLKNDFLCDSAPLRLILLVPTLCVVTHTPLNQTAAVINYY